LKPKTPALHRDVLFMGMPITELVVVVAAAQTKLREKKQGL
jgi:hypothetical protein